MAPGGSVPSEALFGTGFAPTPADPLLKSRPTGRYTASGAPPVANNDSYSVVHDRMLVVEAEEGLLANDTDPDGDPLQVILVSQPSHGTCTFREATPYGDGSFNYLPDAGYVGTDSFTYKISDGTNESSPATATITITNAVPTAQADQYTILEDQVLEVGSGSGFPPPPGGQSLLANDADADDDILRTQLVGNVSNGSLVLRDDGSFVYTPAPNFAGTDSFTYSVTDGVVSANPVTVTITVQANGPFDLDGHDGSTLTPWMSEPDEAAYGLGVSVGHSAQINTRVYNLPSNWVIDSRRVVFDPDVLSVNGVTNPGYIDLSPGGGNEVLTVSALASGYASTEIWYDISGHTVGGGPLGEEFITRVVMNVVEGKAVLRQLEFTSDHNVIRQNTKDVTKSGDRYSDVEFVRATKYNAPMTHTVSYPGIASKVKVKVTWDWAGIPANTPYKLVGASGAEALTFASDLRNTGNLLGNDVVELTAANDVGITIKTINDTTDWEIVLNPGTPNEKILPMGVSGAHKIHLLFNPPAVQAQGLDAFHPTDIRMDRAVVVAAEAQLRAFTAIPAGPTWQRIVFEVVNLQTQRFNPKKSVVPAPIKEENLRNGWKVFDTWTGMPGQGTDCISGVVFAWLVVAGVGVPGSHQGDAFAAKSGAERGTAVSYVANDPARLRITPAAPGIVQELVHVSGPPGQVSHDRFEGAPIYTPPGMGASTFYFPVGAGDARFTNKDHVLTIFTKVSWVLTTNGAEVEPYPNYMRAPNANID